MLKRECIMAKRKRSSKRRRNSGKCPEPFNSLIDLAEAFTFDVIANKMEKKHNYRKRGKYCLSDTLLGKMNID